jgi:phage anti-repressor protein
MNYKKIYDQFIADRKSKEPECYKNKNYPSRVKAGSMASGEFLTHHHIEPRHTGLNNHHSNIVSLTPYEHYFAHLLLAKHFDTPNDWLAVQCVLNAYQKKRLSKKVHGAMVNAATKIAMIDHNPSKKPENRLRLSEAKKSLNPMHNKESLEKMRATRIKQLQENPDMNVIYYVDINGEKTPLKEACKKIGVNYTSILSYVSNNKCTHADAFYYYANTSASDRNRIRIENVVKSRLSSEKRGKNAVLVNGRLMSLPEACDAYKISKDSVQMWIKRGMDATAAFLYVKDTPSQLRNKAALENRSKIAMVKVVCVEKNIQFESIMDACKFSGISRSHMSNVLRGIKKTAAGFHWAYA